MAILQTQTGTRIDQDFDSVKAMLNPDSDIVVNVIFETNDEYMAIAIQPDGTQWVHEFSYNGSDTTMKLTQFSSIKSAISYTVKKVM